jgi:hypothetical protein
MSNEDIWAMNAAAVAADPRQSRERLQLSAAIEGASEFNGSVPEFATSFSRPGEDWKRNCYCAISAGELAGHACPGATATLGERHAAVNRLVTGARRAGQDAAEIARLTVDHGGTFALSAGTGTDQRQKALAGPQGTPSAFSMPDAAVGYYQDLMAQMGISKVYDVNDDADPTDKSQPGKGGVKRVTDGIYGGQPGGDIITRNLELFTHPPSDPGTWGQRSRGLSR